MNIEGNMVHLTPVEQLVFGCSEWELAAQIDCDTALEDYLQRKEEVEYEDELGRHNRIAQRWIEGQYKALEERLDIATLVAGAILANETELWLQFSKPRRNPSQTSKYLEPRMRENFSEEI